MKILAVDISLVFSMAWEASEGKEFSAAFERTIRNVTAARQGFDRCMLAIDSGPSFRKQCPEYKADRTDRGEAYREQLKRTIDRLVADGCVPVVAPAVGSFPLTGAPSYAEADDVIGWACDEYSRRVDALAEEAKPGWSFAILSDDSDMEQLIDDPTGIYVLKSQLRGGEKWDEAKVREKRGVPPEKIPDLKALAGDEADDYDGFCGELPPVDPAKPDVKPKRKPGIGDVTAAKLIRKYGGALEIFDNGNPEKWESDGQPPGLRATLARHGRAQAEKGLFLARIVHDLPGLDFNTVLAEPVVKKIVNRDPVFKEETPPMPAPIPDASFEPVAPPAPPANAEPSPSHALARVITTPIDIYGLQPRSLGEVEGLAKIVMESRAYGFANIEQVMMCIIESRERGVPVGAALRAAYNVRGKLAWSASYLAALVIASGKAEYFEITETTTTLATLAYKRVGRPGGVFVFTIEEAQRAGWCRAGQNGESKWLTNPRTMLRWAAMREAARAFFADVVSGMYTPDEIGGEVRVAEFEAEAA